MAGRQGHIFACTSKTEKECFDRMLFATGRLYGEGVLAIKKGDPLFLLNIDTDTLYGTFAAGSAGAKDISPDAWNGRYPYQVRVTKNGRMDSAKGAKKILLQMGLSWRDALVPEASEALSSYLKDPKTKLPSFEKDDEKPRLESTTLWDYPRQSYGKTPKGSNKYAGVTPAFAIYNMVKRYTEPGDTVLDPMCGSGTTIDVCKEEGRKWKAFDINPTRPEIVQNDARRIPLADESVDMVFIDSPYGDNIDYNDRRGNIGKISAETEEFYNALEEVMAECHRVMKPGKVIGWVIGDQWVNKKFTPVGFQVYERLTRHFETVDVISLARRGQTSNTGMWHSRALRFNFYLRGFKYLFIMKKPDGSEQKKRKVNWKQYER
ncbi:DNA methyltransferase [Candidatus Nitrososphaera sp. FF02]|uniref:DNA methyltransferase n=1 Tax=Candidatus Nitrososphaera sp. FF02 TaxID=3398226 RepID=UPI0039E88551